MAINNQGKAIVSKAIQEVLKHPGAFLTANIASTFVGLGATWASAVKYGREFHESRIKYDTLNEAWPKEQEKDFKPDLKHHMYKLKLHVKAHFLFVRSGGWKHLIAPTLTAISLCTMFGIHYRATSTVSDKLIRMTAMFAAYRSAVQKNVDEEKLSEIDVDYIKSLEDELDYLREITADEIIHPRDTMYVDPYSGRKYPVSEEALTAAVAVINGYISDDGFASLDDFYMEAFGYDVGSDFIDDLGRCALGWNIEDLLTPLEITINTSSSGTSTTTTIHFSVEPHTNYTMNRP